MKVVFRDEMGQNGPEIFVVGRALSDADVQNLIEGDAPIVARKNNLEGAQLHFYEDGSGAEMDAGGHYIVWSFLDLPMNTRVNAKLT